MKYSISVNNGYIIAVIRGAKGDIGISLKEYEEFVDLFASRPIAPDGYIYKLRADNLEWDLVELPPVEPEPLTDEEALIRYANTLTGASDQTLVEAAETLIIDKIKED